MSQRPYLAALADRVGILPAYFDIAGLEHLTSDETRVALITAMGHDVSSEAAAYRALQAIDKTEADRLMPPVRVVRAGSAESSRARLSLTAAHTGLLDWQIEFEAEDGNGCQASGRSPVDEGGHSVTLNLPFAPG